jgi:hypothetical protein
MSKSNNSKENGSAKASVEAKAGTTVSASASSKTGLTHEEKLAMVKRNIEKLKESKKNTSATFFKIQDNEIKIVEFTGEIEPVQRTFTRKNEKGEDVVTTKIMYAYKLMDLERQDEGMKVWEVSKSWSDMIDNLLGKGFFTLEVKRQGSGTNTSYFFSPVVSAPATS